jgi:hypothetical protein
MGFGSIRPVIVTVPKATIAGAVADGAYAALVSVDIPYQYVGSPSMYYVRQILIKSEDQPTTWSVIFHRASDDTNADMDLDTVEAVETVTSNGIDTPQTGVGYYSNSDLHVLITVTPTGTLNGAQAHGKALMQMHFQLGPNGGTKAAGAAGEVVIKFWLEPVMGY